MQGKHAVFAAADIRFWHVVDWMSQRSVWPSSHTTCQHITLLRLCITHFDPEDRGKLCLWNNSYLPITWPQSVTTQDTAAWRPDKSSSSQTNLHVACSKSIRHNFFLRKLMKHGRYAVAGRWRGPSCEYVDIFRPANSISRMQPVCE
jgi:hypothetical protein